MSDEDIPQLRKLAGRVAARAEIQDVRLLKSAVEMHSLPAPPAHLAYNLDKVTAVDYNDGENFFVVIVEYNITIGELEADSEDESTDEATTVAEIQFKIGSLFRLHSHEGDEPLKPEELEAFGATTGQFAVHPFAREYIYDVTGRLALPPLTIGLLHFSHVASQPD